MGTDDLERSGSLTRRSNRKTIHPVPFPPQGTYESVRPKRWKIFWLIPLIVLANVAMLIITMGINNCPKNSINGGCIAKFLGRFSFEPLKENPLLGPSAETLLNVGALESNRVTKQHEGWRLVSCIWLHGGVFHLLVNMLSLVFIGIRLEQEFGFIRIGLLYLLTGFGGSLLSALFIQNQISVGASGALFGLLGAMLSELLTNWTVYSNKCAALSTLIIIIIVNLAVGLLPHIDNFAHIGGFISGFLLGFVILIKPQFGWKAHWASARPDVEAPVKSKHTKYQYVLWIAAFILLLAGYAVAIILLFKGVDVNTKCSWCHYLNCIPTSRWHCNNGGVACQNSFDKGYLTLTCVNNGQAKDFPKIMNASSTQLIILCSQTCS
ncbi:hypothetical protein O6H91_06G103600 [Diphasiastrum complanatum]|uniref:Uncharacterized protein n=1 Tax=Diphasiastrum complanatum TaxID=34168 RepID=A0ACC2DHA4_DIPCM|nr:hypothetical protein O6H91_06G103600 [Diphasiastrum complanatum]